MNINILGGGTWGTTLAHLLSQNNNNILIWQRDQNKTDIYNSTKIYNPLNNYKIPNNITYSSNINELDNSNTTIIALPTEAISFVLSMYENKFSKYLIASKGFDSNTSMLSMDLLVNMHGININDIAILSGPNHAEEIIYNKPATTVIASKNDEFALFLQDMFSSQCFRVYTSSDPIGVQLGGAVKNVIAIASGICAGVDFGDNIQAALVSRGMNEIISLSKVFDIQIETLYGLSGLGDLIATSYSNHSRNWQLGNNLALGFSVEESIKKTGMICEGYNTCKILNKIIIDNNIDMPICTEVYKILFEKSDPKESIHRLMTRELKSENK